MFAAGVTFAPHIADGAIDRKQAMQYGRECGSRVPPPRQRAYQVEG